jgi:hypothetical protein
LHVTWCGDDEGLGASWQLRLRRLGNGCLLFDLAVWQRDDGSILVEDAAVLGNEGDWLAPQVDPELFR